MGTSNGVVVRTCWAVRRSSCSHETPTFSVPDLQAWAVNRSHGYGIQDFEYVTRQAFDFLGRALRVILASLPEPDGVSINLARLERTVVHQQHWEHCHIFFAPLAYRPVPACATTWGNVRCVFFAAEECVSIGDLHFLPYPPTPHVPRMTCVMLK